MKGSFISRVSGDTTGAARCPGPTNPGADGAGRQYLDGNFGVQVEIASAVDLAHATGSQCGKNFVGAEFGTRGQSHKCVLAITRAFHRI